VILGLLQQHLITLRVGHHGEIGLDARANHLRNAFDQETYEERSPSSHGVSFIMVISLVCVLKS
jgi:hypothetical protein